MPPRPSAPGDQGRTTTRTAQGQHLGRAYAAEADNISEREIRPSVVFRKVTNGFKSDWGAQIHAGYRSVTGTARLSGQSALSAIRDLVDGCFSPAWPTLLPTP